MIKLVVSDLDGTLMKLEKHSVESENHYTQNFTIPVHNMESIKELIDNDIKFAVATGNMITLAEKHLWELKDTEFILATQNGSFIEYKDKMIANHYIDNEVKNRVLDYLLDNKIDYISFEDYQYEYHIDTEYKKLVRADVFSGEYLDAVDMKILPIEEIRKKEFSKIKLSFDNYSVEQIEQLEIDLVSKFGHDISIFIASAQNIDFVSINVNKGEAIKEMAKIFDLQLSEIAYFGDSGNDVAAFNVVEHSFVMSHARDNVKANAKYCVDSVSEGIDLIFESINK